MGLYIGPFRFTKRGVRVRVGPRAARLHLGAGGTGISTGAGPFTSYKRLGRKKHSSRRGRAWQPPRYQQAQASGLQQPEPTVLHPSGYGRAAQPPQWGNPPPQRGKLPPPTPRRPWTRRRILLWSAVGVVGLVIVSIIGEASNPPSTPVSHHKPVPAVVATSSSPAASSPAAIVTSSPAAVVTTPAQQPATMQPVTTQPAPAPQPVGCHPLSNEGTCYEPGEYCRNIDHGVTGVAGDGETIECEYNNGWRWEPT